MDNLKKLGNKFAILKDKEKRIACQNYLAVFIILLTALLFFLCGCTSKYERAYALNAAPPAMKPIPVSDAVRLIHERETDPDAIYDEVENVFVIPPELDF